MNIKRYDYVYKRSKLNEYDIDIESMVHCDRDNVSNFVIRVKLENVGEIGEYIEVDLERLKIYSERFIETYLSKNECIGYIICVNEDINYRVYYPENIGELGFGLPIQERMSFGEYIIKKLVE